MGKQETVHRQDTAIPDTAHRVRQAEKENFDITIYITKTYVCLVHLLNL